MAALSIDEILRRVAELSADERRRLSDALEALWQDETRPPAELATAWADWLSHGPQGPIDDDDEAAWP